MATRASVVIYDEWDDKPICEMFKHWDGYPDGFGKDLQAFCDKYKIINGISGQTAEQGYANGMGCFAAQLIKHFKKDIGDISMIAVGQGMGQEYRYHVRASKLPDDAEPFGMDMERSLKVETEEV